MKVNDRIEQLTKIGSYETDLSTGTWTGSNQFIEIFGLTPKNHYSVEEFQKLVHPDDFDEVMAHFGNCLKNGDYFDMEYRCIRSDGKIIHVVSKSNIVRDNDGKPIKVKGVKQDITERKLNEIRLEELHRQNMNNKEILSIAAHDLKSPIAQIKGILNLIEIKEGGQNQKLKSFINEALEISESIIQQLVDIAELEDKNYRISKKELDINDIVRSVINHYNIIADRKNIILKSDLASVYNIRGNKITLIRLIDNLLSNAIKFSYPGSEIMTRTYNIDKTVVLEIKDTGIGMNAEQLSELFTKFSRFKRKGTSGESTSGLGLYIVKQIANAHSAEIDVQSLQGKGTTFTVRFPIA